MRALQPTPPEAVAGIHPDMDIPSPVRLGGAATHGEQVQAVVPAGQWQSAVPVAGAAGYALISCIVAPAFEFSGFELAPAGWAPAQ